MKIGRSRIDLGLVDLTGTISRDVFLAGIG